MVFVTIGLAFWAGSGLMSRRECEEIQLKTFGARAIDTDAVHNAV